MGPDDYTNELESFYLRLYTIGAVKIDTLGGFKLKAHEKNPHLPLSPIYVNLRVAENKGGPLTQEDVARVAYFFHETAKRAKMQYHGIAGVPHAGNPLAQAMRDRVYALERRNVSVLTFAKNEGPERRSIGAVQKVEQLPRSSPVVVVDDLITKADSKVEAIVQLRGTGFGVNDCIVFLDREQGGGEGLKACGVKLHAVTTLSHMLDYYRRANIMSQVDHDSIRNYIAAN